MTTIRFVTCGDYCGREAKWQPDDIVTQLAERKTQDEKAAYANNVIRCTIHKAATMRSRYNRINYVPVDSVTLGLARKYQQAKQDLADRREAERSEKEHVRARSISVRYWRELDEEPDYVVVYEEDDRYRSGPPIRQWSCYTTAQVEAVDPLDTADRRWSPQFRIEVKEDPAHWDDIINPAYLRTSASNQLTPKLARIYAETLPKAAEMVAATNARLRAKHEALASRY
jgi:hypothetical protein